MNREQKIALLAEVRNSFIEITKEIFDDMLLNLDLHTYEGKTGKVVKAQKAKLALRAQRQQALDRIKQIGKGYLGEL